MRDTSVVTFGYTGGLTVGKFRDNTARKFCLISLGGEFYIPLSLRAVQTITELSSVRRGKQIAHFIARPVHIVTIPRTGLTGPFHAVRGTGITAQGSANTISADDFVPKDFVFLRKLSVGNSVVTRQTREVFTIGGTESAFGWIFFCVIRIGGAQLAFD